MVTDTITVAAPAAAVLAVLDDVERWPSWQREVERVEVHDQDGAGRPVRATVHIRAVGFTGWYRVEYRYPRPDRIEFHLLDSDMMSRHDASFDVDERAGRTQLRVGMDTALRWPLPRLVVAELTRRSVRTMLASVKSRAESG